MAKYGRFDEQAREYVITRPDTPAPWINYLMGRDVNAIVSQAAGGLAFYKEPSEGRLTRYRFNGLPVDSPGFYLYIQDGETTWNPSFRPTCTPLDRFECRHGLGYTRFDSERNGIRADVTYLAPLEDDVLLWSVRLTNNSRSPRRLKLTSYMEFSLHEYVKDALWYLVCGNQWRLTFDRKANGIKSRYFAFQSVFKGQCIFASTAPVRAFEIDRDRFIGFGRSEANPVGLERGLCNSEIPDGGRHACGALQSAIVLAPGQTRHVLYRYAVSKTFAESARILARYRTERDVERAKAGIARFWDGALGSAQVRTPDRAANVMLNTWLPYNIRVTFRLGRSVSSRHTGTAGALRYRDSMQDAMPAPQLFPVDARERIERILHTMYADGHCAMGVNPETLKPSPEEKDLNRSDAAVWGVFTVYQYLAESGDLAFLNRVLPYLDKGEGSVFEHLLRSLTFIAEHTGKDGLPQLFTVDWNDFLQIFTVSYTGCQSVMVAQQFIYATRLLTEMAEQLGRGKDVAKLRAACTRFTRVLESKKCWDGDWYRRLLGDNLVMGSKQNRDAKIFLNTQSWAVIAGTLDGKRVTRAMNSAYKRLNTEFGLRIFSPAFWTMPDGKTEVPSNTPGAGENGGIFVHANMWAIMAEALLGRGDRAWQYFSQVLPPKQSERDPDRYANEPYAFTSWIYGPDHERYGTAQLSWLTGGTAWMYLVGLEYILGVRPTLAGLRIDPCIPARWKRYSVRRRWRGTLYDITVENPSGICKGDVALQVDGEPIEGNLLAPTESRYVKVRAVLRRREV
ncbi:MAG: glycosyl hydrolase family 65 protein [bacterium]